MKDWVCVQVRHHDDVGKTIQEYEGKGWNLHTYTCSQHSSAEIRHYLLFEREKEHPIRIGEV